GESVEQFVLLADDVDIRAVAEMRAGEAFAAGLFGVADGEDDRIRAACHFHRFLDELQVALARGEFDRALRAVLTGSDEDALRGDEIGSGRDLTQAFDQADGLLRNARIAAEPG